LCLEIRNGRAKKLIGTAENKQQMLIFTAVTCICKMFTMNWLYEGILNADLVFGIMCIINKWMWHAYHWGYRNDQKMF